jgi:hypothetical protein
MLTTRPLKPLSDLEVGDTFMLAMHPCFSRVNIFVLNGTLFAICVMAVLYRKL